ncbi:MAG: hypothetical protein ACK4V1_12150, partial [Burkholderiaceae bacterium]
AFAPFVGRKLPDWRGLTLEARLADGPGGFGAAVALRDFVFAAPQIDLAGELVLRHAGRPGLHGRLRGARIDATALHALLVGFVLSMVFGHAPIIFPAVLRVKLPYTPWLYLPLALLHASLLLRVAGVAAESLAVRAWGGAGHAAAIALFIVTMAGNALRARR